MISPTIKSKIEKVVNVFETGKALGDYAKIVKYRDYKDPKTGIYVTQITYGRSQTTEFGNLKNLIAKYTENKGLYAGQMAPFLTKIGKQPTLASNTVFCDLLKQAGEKDPIMQKSQDDVFDSYYYLPALGWFTQMGFKSPLSLLVIYDSHIHSGGIPDFLRKRFSASPPVKGGNENEWVKQYVDVRHAWLETHPNKILNNTIYRTNCFKKQVKNNNWDMQQVIDANGTKIA